MGGAVSSGESNDELVDNLLEADYIKSARIERVFRAVDRGLYYTEPHKSNAYKDLAWKDGNLHLSAPCIYSEVMENLELKQGMSFLNLGSGTGYLSTMCGLLLGKNGVNHGIELHSDVVDYAREKLEEFLKVSPAIDSYEFAVPGFVVGNCLEAISTKNRYDRIYCGAACPEDYVKNIVDLLKIGGICVMPINDSLVQITRISEDADDRRSLLPVSFATLMLPRKNELENVKTPIVLPEWEPHTLKELCRFEIREVIRSGFMPPVGTQTSAVDESRKKRRRKRQERRRASRLLVVQRRRSGGDEGETGFVAVAYSLGNNHSSEDETYIRERNEQMNTSGESDDSNSNEPVPPLEDSNGHPIEDRRTSAPIPLPPRTDSSRRQHEDCPSRRASTPVRGGQSRGVLSRARAARQQSSASPRETSSDAGGGGGTGSGGMTDAFFRRVRELRDMYRRQQDQRPTGFRQLMNAVSSATNSVLVRPSSANNANTTNNTSADSSTEQSTSNGASTSTSKPTSNTRSKKDSGCDDSCVYSSDSSVDSSPSSNNDNDSPSSDEGGHHPATNGQNITNGTTKTKPKKIRRQRLGPRDTDHRVSASAESGVVTDSPERIEDEDDEDDDDLDEEEFGDAKEEQTKDDENMEVDDSAIVKLKQNPVSVEMRSRINKLPLPPPVKIYINYYRQLEFD